MIKSLEKLEIRGKLFNLIKRIYVKPTDNIVLSGGRLKAFPLRPAATQVHPHHFYSIFHLIIAREIRQ